MAVIDADTHVDECEETWEYIPESEAQFRPVTEMEDGGGRGFPGYGRHWRIDGNLTVRRIRDDARTGTKVESRELHDVNARLRQMDDMGVDIHVIYPTMFLTYYTSNPVIQTAICRSYNRWLADRTEKSGGRLRWAAVLPFLDINAAFEELRWTSDKGACGVFKLATEIGKRVTDPYFTPIYEAAADLGLPICLHTGSADPPRQGGGGGGDGIGGGTMLDAFSSIIVSGLPKQFPALRFGFIEAGASWIPYVLDRLWARRERMAWAYGSFNYSADMKSVFRENRLYVTTQSHEDIPYLMNFGTEDYLMIGTDYSHADQSAEIQAIDIVRQMGTEGRLSQTAVRKILEDNPKTFYGL